MMGCESAPASIPAAVPNAIARPANADAVLARCEGYRETVPEAYGLCLKQGIGGLKTVADVARVCGLAGAWELECRAGWVGAQSRKNVSPQVLLEACGDSADCALQQLDASPDADVLVQMERCQRHAGTLAEACVGHALQRWAVARPSAAEVARVHSRPGTYDFQIGTFIGMVAQCQGTVVCPTEEGPLAKGCAQGQASYARNPERCGG
ncbi:hypothetical protein LBMAG42_46620 [Deltaproteobacteria bacterium]|nr:hypothetical protein LBMAG42_46620 [Deltaproteobacteria bacterium]